MCPITGPRFVHSYAGSIAYRPVQGKETRCTQPEPIRKEDDDGGWIKGGFVVLEQSVFYYIDGDMTSWETQPLQALAAEGELRAYQHRGFWHAMDTLRDKNYLEELWHIGPPWKLWS